jgi:hypothetical protein
MTVHRWRLSAVERLLGMEEPQRSCSQCGGSGMVCPADGEHTRWELDRVFAEVAGRLGVQFPDPGVEPTDEPRTACGLCRGAGVVSAVTAASWRRRGIRGGTRFEADLVRVAERMSMLEVASAAEERVTPTLTVVD